jgi:hypothetical protein
MSEPSHSLNPSTSKSIPPPTPEQTGVLSVVSDLLRILRKLRPDHKFPENFVDDNIRDLSQVKNQRGAELLKEDFGMPGWTSLSASLENNISIYSGKKNPKSKLNLSKLLSFGPLFAHTLDRCSPQGS